VAPVFKFSDFKSTRGNDFKIETARTHYDLQKYYFTNRVGNIWNSLPNDIIKVSNFNQFKNKLDKWWVKQEMMYDYKADLTGIGSNSRIEKV